MRIVLVILVLAISGFFSIEANAAGKPPVATGTRRRAPVKEWAIKGTLYTHRDASRIAATDMAAITRVPIGQESTIPVEAKKQWSYIRYLSLHNIPKDFRVDYYSTSSFTLNSLAGLGLGDPRQTIVRPAYGGPENTLIRVNLFDYGIDPAAWDRLAAKDPYFSNTVIHTEVITEEVEDGQPFWNAVAGKWQVYVKTVTREGEKTVLRGPAAWCDQASSAYLVSMTQSTSPILRADWFIRNVTLEPHYSDFLGIKTLDDFLRLTGFDRRAERTKQVKSTIVTSGSDGLCPRVAQNNRILSRVPTFNGYIWQTDDFKTSIGEQNVITNIVGILKGTLKRDAGEYIGTLPNGLQVYFLVNGKNEPVAFGDPEVVRDTIGHDGIVRNGRSCHYCHAAGINAFKSQFQQQIGYRADQADLGFYDSDPVKAAELAIKFRDIFGAPNFDAIIAQDRNLFSAAVSATNGLDAQTNGLLYKQIWERYDVDNLDRTQAELELGLYSDDLTAALALRFEGRSNGVLIQLLHNPVINIRRDQWEEAFHEAALLSTVIKPTQSPAKP